MRQLMTVVRFELYSYFKNKGYIVGTILFSVLLGLGLCVPNILMSTGIIDDDDDSTSEEQVEEVEDTDDVSASDLVLIYDQAGAIVDATYMEDALEGYKVEYVNSREEIETKVKDETASAGFVVTDQTSYEYIVQNTTMFDSLEELFSEALSYEYRYEYMKTNNIDIDKMETVLDTQMIGTSTVLGKDSVGSYGYTYVLIFVIYFMLILYGQMIATSVTSEKSNRAIEVLITSTKPDYLIFGKVIAGAIASFLQIIIVVGVGLISYNANAKQWSGVLDSVLVIPTSVLIIFFIFLVLGFFFYSFLYASLGALVSKTEDISKAIGPVMMIFVVGFMLAITGLNFPDGMLVKVTSFIPFTASYMMLVRAAMGTVSIVELIISGVILAASSVVVGVIGAKVYRMGTLHYGNPLKLRNVLKRLIKE